MKLKFVLLFVGMFLQLQNAFSKVVNVIDYGAVTNKNSTNAFENAIEELEDGDILFIPEGTYILDQLKFSDLSSITITGRGQLMASEKGNSYFITIYNCPFILIEGIVFDGNNSKNLGIDIYDSPNGVIQNSSIKNIQGKKHNWSSAIRLRKDNSNFLINHVNIVNVSSHQKAAVGIYVMSYNNENYSQNIVIRESKISNIDSPQDADGIKIQQIGRNSNFKVTDCFFSNNRKRAIKIQTDNAQIVNNKVERTEEYGNGFSVFSAYGNDIDIVANESVSYGDSSVNMFVDLSAVRNIKIKDNIHSNSFDSKTKIRDFILTKYHSGEQSFSTKNVSIENNKVKNIRNFLRVRSNLNSFKIIHNNIIDLESNYIFVVDDQKITEINVINQYNTINYKKYSYKEIYSPKRINLITK